MLHFIYLHLAESVKRGIKHIICLHVCLHWNDRGNNAAYPDTNSSNDTALNSQELEPLPPYSWSVDKPKVMQSILGVVNSGTSAIAWEISYYQVPSFLSTTMLQNKMKQLASACQ